LLARNQFALKNSLRAQLDVSFIIDQWKCWHSTGPLCFFSWLTWKVEWSLQPSGSNNL
jgi:hypothetical protein